MKAFRGRHAAAVWGLSLAAAIGWPGCEGGTSSETVGVVEAQAGRDGISGRTDAGNSVGLYSSDFLPHLDSGFAMTITVDSNGTFAFPNLRPGHYRMLVRRPADGKAALLPDIAIPAETNAAIRAGLEPTGTLSGTITDPESTLAGLVYAPGTPFSAVGDSLMRYELKGLPAGNYAWVKAWKKKPPCQPGAICGSIETGQDSAMVGIPSGAGAVW